MLLVAVALVGCIWVGVYAFDAVDEDAQGGINLVFIPILQLGGVICAACLGGAFDWIAQKVRAGS